jgi:hypothetical protein
MNTEENNKIHLVRSIKILDGKFFPKEELLTHGLSNTNLNNDAVSKTDAQDEDYWETPEQYESENDIRESTPARRPKRQAAILSRAKTIAGYSNHVSIHETLKTPEWKKAMEAELNSLRENDTWELAELPEGTKPLNVRWLYKLKRNTEGEIVKHKARLIVQGYRQKFGVDYDETWAPVLRKETLRLILQTAAIEAFDIHHMDVVTAFLQAEIDRDVYIRQPPGFQDANRPDAVCKLKRSIYGLKQSPRLWNNRIDTYIKSMGFIPTADPCLYLKHKDNRLESFIGLYVDDLIIGTNNQSLLKEIKQKLKAEFKIEDSGRCTQILGMKILLEKSGIYLNQSGHIQQLSENLNLKNLEPYKSPMTSGFDRSRHHESPKLNESMKQKYQALIGGLLYIAGSTRPDISYAVGVLSRYNSQPTKAHWTAGLRVLGYLQSTSELSLFFPAQTDNKLTVYSDADWAGDASTRRSTSGMTVVLGGGVIHWKSKLQPCVALSTCEAELYALSIAVTEGIALKRILSQIYPELDTDRKPIPIMEDNLGTIAVVKNTASQHTKLKHIDIRKFFLHEKVVDGVISLQECSTSNMISDGLTKALEGTKFQNMIQSFGLEFLPSSGSVGFAGITRLEQCDTDVACVACDRSASWNGIWLH